MISRPAFAFFFPIALALSSAGQASKPQPPTDSSSAHHPRKTTPAPTATLDPGSVTGGEYHNKTFAFACKIPEGWVLRTDEMNTRDDDNPQANQKSDSSSQRVLLAAFSRPPQARGEDINSSILIAAEIASSYPGLTDAAQYFGPLGEVAKAQGLEANDESYEMDLGGKFMARADFQKDVGSRVLRQSTLVMLSHDYVLSFTFIGGTESEVDQLIEGLSFTGIAKPRSR